MKRPISVVCATAMILSMIAPASAGMVQAPSVPVRPDVIRVQGTDYSGGSYYPDDYGRYGDRFVRRGDIHYWRGHRGSRYPRPGYRRHGDWWFPAGAFIAGAIIGGIVTSQPNVRYRLSGTHVRWCYGHYRSYRERDNTFQPYHGLRRQCTSPYWP